MNNETKINNGIANKPGTLQTKLQLLPHKTKLLIIYGLAFVIFFGALYFKLLVNYGFDIIQKAIQLFQ